MECNKEEAVRARDIAEKKMQSNDFQGARKFALKAKSLYPELENMTQMLNICDVYCSAEIRLSGSDKDWYGVLQVEKFADEATIKKQYRRLALILHPDKNRYPGAEGAFKLICEANAVLSDPAKKSLYDHKIKVSVKPPSGNPSNKNYQTNNAQNTNISNGFSSQNQHKATSQFWTSCPFCSNSYMYSRQFINRSFNCPKCCKPFTAFEVSAPRVPSVNMGPQGVPPKPNVRQPQEKVRTYQANTEIGVQNLKVPSKARAGSKGTANMKKVKPEPGAQKSGGSESINIANAAENLKTKETANLNSSSLRGTKKVGVTSNGDAVRGGSRNARTKTHNRRAKLVLESSDGSDTDIEDVTEQENIGSADLKTEFARGSSRRRNHVSYKETDVDDDDYARYLKKANTTQEANGKEHKDAVGGKDSKHGFPTAPGSSSLKDRNEGCGKEGEIRGVTGGRSSASADAVEIEIDSDLDFSLSDDSEPRFHECPDPEFHNFDKLREESKFRVNQFWAFYDTTSESMPRFYAKVKKVRSSPFELDITWLEAVAIDDSWENWVDKELPVGCGSFKLGQSEKVSGSLSLSHQVHCQKGKKRGSCFIYPREGEVWALYRDWDISWSSDLVSGKKFRYEVVEVLSDFAAGVGIKVVFLDKISGFVSLFQRAVQSETFVIVPTELYRFSHCIPSFKMTGNEREGVPMGSFELDPACLPIDPDDLYFPSKRKIESTDKGSSVHSSVPRYGLGKGKCMASESTCSPHKIVDLEGTGGNASNLRRSARVGKTN